MKLLFNIIILFLFFPFIFSQGFNPPEAARSEEPGVLYLTNKPYNLTFRYDGVDVTLDPIRIDPGNISVFDFNNYYKKWQYSKLSVPYQDRVDNIVLQNQTEIISDYTLMSLGPVKSPKTSGERIIAPSKFFMMGIGNRTYVDYVRGDNFNPNYKSIKTGPVEYNDFKEIFIDFPESCGSFSLLYDYFGKSMNMTYANPLITKSLVNNNQVTLDGDNFYNTSSKITISINGGSNIPTTSIISVSHQRLVFNNVFTNSQYYKLNISVCGISSIYNLPVPSILSSITSTSNKGGIVTLVGTKINFTNTNGSSTDVKVTIGGKQCTNVNKVQDGTKLTCIAPQGNTDNIDTIVYIDGIPSNPIKFNFIPSIISGVSQDHNQFEFVGDSFGNIKDTKVLINGFECPVISISSSMDRIKVSAPKTIPNASKVQIKIGTKLSNIFEFNVTPVIESISKPSTNGSTITINGYYLYFNKPNSADLYQASLTNTDSSDMVFSCSNFRNYNDKGDSFVCDLNGKGVGINRNVTITIDNRSAIYPVLTFAPPVITSVYQSDSIGYVNGWNFGIYAQYLQVIIQGKQFKVDKVNHTEIQFNIPIESKLGLISVIVGGQESNQGYLNLTPLLNGHGNITTQGGSLIIYGSYFSPFAKYKVVIGENECTNAFLIDKQDYSKIQCTIPSGTGANKNISVTMDDKEIRNPTQFKFSYDLPSVSSVTSVGLNGGNITIQGTSFGTPVKVSIGDRVCANAEESNFNLITCSIDPFASIDQVPTTSQTLRVEVDSLVGEYTDFKYEIPGASSETTSENEETKKKSKTWLVPTILLPVLALVGASVAGGFYLKKRNDKLKQQNGVKDVSYQP